MTKYSSFFREMEIEYWQPKQHRIPVTTRTDIIFIMLLTMCISLFSLFNASYHVKPPVGLNLPALIVADGDLFQEVTSRLFLSALLLQRIAQVAHVLRCAQLGDAREQHEGEECHKQPGLRAQGQVGLDTYVLGRGGSQSYSY